MEPISLMEPEQQLIEHTMAGTLLDFALDEEIDLATVPAWGGDRTIRAEVIRDVLLGRLVPEPDPHGLQLRGARIAGRLDLTRVKTDVSLTLLHCVLEDGMDARDAQLPALILAGSHLTHASEPALEASRLSVGQLALNRAWITSDCTEAAVRLVRARISDLVGFTGATVRNTRGPAIRADGLLVERNVVLNDGFTAEGAGADGAVRLVGGWIGGDFTSSHAVLRNRSGAALVADKLRVDQSLALVHQFTAIGAGAAGTVRLAGATVGGQLSFTGATVRNESGPALFADGVHVQQSVFLRNGFTATGSGEQGTVTVVGARVGGDLLCTSATLENRSGPAWVADGVRVDQDLVLHSSRVVGTGEKGAVRLPDADIGGKLGVGQATLRNDSGPALDGDRIHVKQGLYLDRGLEVVGAGQYCAVRLSNARIDAEFQCVGATLRNDTGSALSADGMVVARNLEFGEGFAAVGNGEDGAVRMLGASIGGQFQLVGATIHSGTGPALSADRLQVAENMIFADGLNVTGAGDYGVARLSGARIDGQLTLMSATVRNESGPALVASELQVGQSVQLSQGFQAVGAGAATIDLSGAQISGRLIFDPGRLEHTTNTRARLSIDGLVYSGLPVMRPSHSWLDLIRLATPAYSSQPYQQLAAVHKSAGHDAEYRDVLIAQRRDQINRGAATGWRAKAWAWILRATLGYGYKPWRALWWLTGVATLAVFITLALGQWGGVTAVDSTTNVRTRCSVVEQVGVAIDLSVPLIKAGTPGRCEVTTDTAGQVLTIAGWILQLLAWIFATLFVAGFTSAVRKT